MRNYYLSVARFTEQSGELDLALDDAFSPEFLDELDRRLKRAVEEEEIELGLYPDIIPFTFDFRGVRHTVQLDWSGFDCDGESNQCGELTEISEEGQVGRTLDVEAP